MNADVDVVNGGDSMGKNGSAKKDLANRYDEVCCSHSLELNGAETRTKGC